ncbi:MAG: SPFH domain-containing protein [Oscillospiraceae bacterium]|nr:SPFH domain-containing protein [Oscillospiraceae bacterium]
MGLIKAAVGALGGTLADQWKEFFYCESMPKEVMVTKGQKRITGRSSNTKGNDNIISNGSGIAVADGQCMIIVEQGKVVEVCAEPGQFTYNTSTEPSIFAGSLGKSIIDTFKTLGKRFTYGGDTGKDQRVYYFNTKELVDNKFGTPNPIPFRIVDTKIGLDIDVSVRCSGVFSYKIDNPILFYTNVCGNVESDYTRDELDSQLKAEFISALQPAFGKLSELELRPNQIISHNTDLENAMNSALSAKWGELRGLKVVTIAMSSVTLPEADAEMIKQAQRNAIMRDPTMAAATLVGAQADAMKAAAANEGGAMNGFVGMGMAMNAGGGMNTQNLFAMGAQQKANNQASAPAANTENTAGGWKCSCGAIATGKFCTECGAKKPEEGWTCACGAVNKGKFCSECGAKKPLGAVQYRCDKCGWEPEKGAKPPKFCPECGDPMNENDIK